MLKGVVEFSERAGQAGGRLEEGGVDGMGEDPSGVMGFEGVGQMGEPGESVGDLRGVAEEEQRRLQGFHIRTSREGFEEETAAERLGGMGVQGHG